MKTYRLNELETDAWVEALSALDDEYLDEAIELADDATVINWARFDRCPAELETEYAEIARRHNCRFDKLGRVVSHD